MKKTPKEMNSAGAWHDLVDHLETKMTLPAEDG